MINSHYCVFLPKFLNLSLINYNIWLWWIVFICHKGILIFVDFIKEITSSITCNVAVSRWILKWQWKHKIALKPIKVSSFYTCPDFKGIIENELPTNFWKVTEFCFLNLFFYIMGCNIILHVNFSPKTNVIVYVNLSFSNWENLLWIYHCLSVWNILDNINLC